MSIRPSHGLSLLLVVFAMAVLAISLDLQSRQTHAVKVMIETEALVSRLQLTDLCLSTEASYTRHPSQADFFAPFADHPGAYEHFPSGTIIGPAPHLKGHHAAIP